MKGNLYEDKKSEKKVAEKLETNILWSMTVFKKSCRLWDNVEKYCTAGACHIWQYGACALHAGYLKLQTQTNFVLHLFIFHCNNGCTYAPHCYVIRTVSVLFPVINIVYFYWIWKIYTIIQKNLCIYLYNLHSEHRISCCRHAAQILLTFPHHVRGLVGLLQSWRVQRPVCSRWDCKLPYDTNLHSLMSTEKSLVYVSDKT